jgi:hypothetical protein
VIIQRVSEEPARFGDQVTIFATDCYREETVRCRRWCAWRIIVGGIEHQYVELKAELGSITSRTSRLSARRAHRDDIRVVAGRTSASGAFS